MTAAIKTLALTKSFGDLKAVDSLTIEVAEGELFGLVGPDGAGKTTTMRLLTAIMEPTSGEAWVNGKSIRTQAEAIKDDIGYVSQKFGLYQDLTVAENIDFYADIYGVPKDIRTKRAEELLEFSHLTAFKKRLAGNLSGGMKQKLGLTCALIHTPKVLFLDEPTNGVDPVSRREFWRILYRLLAEKVTIFVSTAYLDEAERCNRVGLMHKGRLLACAAPDLVKTMMRGAIVELRASDVRRAADLLREKSVGHAVSLFGDKVHVAADNAEQVMENAKQALSAAGITVTDARIIAPSLEDVFVSVVTESTSGGNSGEQRR